MGRIDRRAWGGTLAKRGNLQRVSDTAIRALLERYNCRVPFHEVRARFMGNIATPDLTASPMQVVRDLWGGTLPEFETLDDARLLVNGLVQGLWNGLSGHQKRSNPFRLARVKSLRASYDYLARLSLLRRQELDGFIDGLFAGQQEMDFPEKAHRALGVLAEIRAMVAGIYELAKSPPSPASTDSLEETATHLRQLTRIAEAEINTVIQSCKTARAQMLETTPFKRQTLH